MSDTEQSSTRLTLITGASRGIGRALADYMAGPDQTLILIATPKSQGALEELDDNIRAKGGHAVLVPMDLHDGEGIDRLGGALYDRFGRLDAVMGGAAHLGPISPIGHVDPKTFARIQSVNVTANWRIMRSFQPLLSASDNPRAVFLTDGNVSDAKPFWSAYGASKAALNHLVLTWAAELQKTPIRVNLYDPGKVASRLRKTAMPGEDQALLCQAEEVVPQLAKLLSASENRHGMLIRYQPTLN